ncbi:hypothetical protein NCCP2716_27570 [Sporosarcina sp. NCCP-2716]|uniref:DUF1064 domain-containing protein n=1 Tax=Sporosarcina sp. NCCP-2716 TaxID=2943679 RepID=UPI0020426740|nr:DUF1064 domain-containing protein [Sporosarcina sp. NCCP-2716]GKV70259.1 hypothetical protein NCCP2716_27570 [Sporosarcina sp. NCCP-2716]
MRNRQKGGRAVRQPRQFIAKKITVDGVEFDSQTEAAYYQLLRRDPTIRDIEIQPQYKIIDNYTVTCKRCAGSGKQVSVKTGNPINCKLCRGNGEREKAGAVYTADFRVTYMDGFQEIVDVKGGPVTRDFPLRRKLLERAIGRELVVVRRKGKEWVRE